MLVNDNITRDLKQVASFLQKFESQTDRRYSQQVSNLVSQLSAIERGVKSELVHKENLRKYQMQGFQVESYASRAYSRVDELDKIMVDLKRAIEDVMPALNEYKANAQKLPQAARITLDALFKNPATFAKAKQMWALAKGRIQKQNQAGDKNGSKESQTTY